MKLVQKYTEAQDIQYEKEKKMMVGKESMLNTLIADHEDLLHRQEEQMILFEDNHTSNRNDLETIANVMADSLRR